MVANGFNSSFLADALTSLMFVNYKNILVMPSHFFFYLAVSFILIHEMDAVRCKEWRIFPILSLLDDKSGFQVFMFAHIPLFFFLLWVLLGQESPTYWIRGLNFFFILHLIAHILLVSHPKNEFKDWISWLWIIGAALFGCLDLLLG